jgi:hypothetical protein
VDQSLHVSLKHCIDLKSIPAENCDIVFKFAKASQEFLQGQFQISAGKNLLKESPCVTFLIGCEVCVCEGPEGSKG